MTHTQPTHGENTDAGLKIAQRRALGNGAQLRTRLADDLRARLRGGEWGPGQRLPTEAALLTEYGVSRSTVRAALQQLESQGLTVTRHGVGTFATPFGQAINAGLQELRSMTDTIAAHGRTPRMDFHQVQFRAATADECHDLRRPGGCQVLATARAVYADDLLVAFSYETIPADILDPDLRPDEVHGSLFRLLESCGVVPRTAVADVHAVRGDDIGWGDRPLGANYLLLQQVHHDERANPVVLSRTYFIEGRFQFSILRVR